LAKKLFHTNLEMPKEIKILLPDSSSDEYFDIHIRHSGKKNITAYRYEIWDLEKDNPFHLSAADFLRKKISACSDNWLVAEIFAEENKKIPILLKHKQIN
ncbi:MAG: hypothetical protein PF484_04405, partial [Bacteroidales bacterium]|nr:hypothetical protein [Bacteroidales bacterium]